MRWKLNTAYSYDTKRELLSYSMTIENISCVFYYATWLGEIATSVNLMLSVLVALLYLKTVQNKLWINRNNKTAFENAS